MASGSLLLLLDDIASVMDDVAVLSKVAARKTAGVLGDDLALNAQQVVGVRPERELPVVWGVAKGSLLNKVILVPLALFISAFAPWAITPLLMLGGVFLCFEGFEKLYHLWTKNQHTEHREERAAAMADPATDMQDFERKKIKGAIRTDFILSAEIIAITLGTVANAPLLEQFLVLSAIALLVTVGVYGLVAAIVKLDDLGLYLTQHSGYRAALGRRILWFAPYLMKALSIIGTAAMFLVGGGILIHGIGPLASWLSGLSAGLGGMWVTLVDTLNSAIVGILAGAVVFLLVAIRQRVLHRPRS